MQKSTENLLSLSHLIEKVEQPPIKIDLCKYFKNSFLVNEFSREYLEKLTRKYIFADLLNIAKGQRKNEIQAIKNNYELIISDTTIQEIKIWSIEKFNKCEPWILNQEDNYNHYLLCKPDIPWDPDPLRENPFDRERLFNIHLKYLQNKSYTIICGDKKSRFLMAKKIINSYLTYKKNK